MFNGVEGQAGVSGGRQHRQAELMLPRLRSPGVRPGPADSTFTSSGPLDAVSVFFSPEKWCYINANLLTQHNHIYSSGYAFSYLSSLKAITPTSLLCIATALRT